MVRAFLLQFYGLRVVGRPASEAQQGLVKSSWTIVIGDSTVRGSDCGSKEESRMVCCLRDARVQDVL